MSSTYSEFLKWLNAQPALPSTLRELHGQFLAGNTMAGAQLEIEAMRLAVKAAKSVHRRFTDEKGVEPDMDMVQEASAAAIDAAARWEPDKGSFVSWVMRRAAGAAIDHWRREKAAGMGGKDHRAELEDIHSLLLLEHVWEGDPDDSAFKQEPEMFGYDPEEDAEKEANSAKIATLVGLLPTRLRTIVVSYFGYRTPKLTLREIAKRETLSLPTVRARLAEAIAFLREQQIE